MSTQHRSGYSYTPPPTPPAPQILPWLAREAALPDARAEALWVTACRQTSLKGIPSGSSEFWKQAMATLHCLLEAESSQLDQKYVLRRWVRLQRKIHTLQATWLDAGITVAARLQRAVQHRRSKLTPCH